MSGGGEPGALVPGGLVAGELQPGSVTDALAVALEMAPLPAHEVLAGAPLAGYAVLGHIGVGDDALEVGVWEMTEGTATDVEADEVFVVLAGSATVEIEGVATPLELNPGTVVHLSAGMCTVWTVHEALRKFVVS